MATILKKKYNKRDSTEDILKAIITLATDKNERLLLDDCIEWLEVKLKEVARLVRILKRRHSVDVSRFEEISKKL